MFFSPNNTVLRVLCLERAVDQDASRRVGSGDSSSSRGQLNIPDDSTLSRYVAARLDLPISQSLLDQPYKMSVIKRCWEDQLRLKRKMKLIH